MKVSYKEKYLFWRKLAMLVIVLFIISLIALYTETSVPTIKPGGLTVLEVR